MSDSTDAPTDADNTGLASRLALINDLADGKYGVKLAAQVDWNDTPDNLPDGSQEALDEITDLSKRFAGVTGTSVDPTTGDIQPRKNLLMRAAANGNVDPPPSSEDNPRG